MVNKVLLFFLQSRECGIPGWQGLQAATGVDVAGAVVDHLVTRMASSSRASEVTT